MFMHKWLSVILKQLIDAPQSHTKVTAIGFTGHNWQAPSVEVPALNGDLPLRVNWVLRLRIKKYLALNGGLPLRVKWVLRIK